jgi:hypothetical protein
MSNPKIHTEMSEHDSEFMFQLICEVHSLLDRRLAEYEKEADYQPYSHLSGTFCLKVAFSILRRLFQTIKTETDLHLLEAIMVRKRSNHEKEKRRTTLSVPAFLAGTALVGWHAVYCPTAA